MGLLNRAALGAQPQGGGMGGAPMGGGMPPRPPMMGGGAPPQAPQDPMQQIIEMLRQRGVPVDQMPPQQLQQLVMQVMQGGAQG
jgi:hypothetical protein